MLKRNFQRVLRFLLRFKDRADPVERTSSECHPTFDRDNCTKPYLLFSRPGSMFPQGEAIMVSVFNPDDIPLSILVIQSIDGSNNTLKTIQWESNPCHIKLADVSGNIQIVARERRAPKHVSLIRSNSIFAQIMDQSEEGLAQVVANRINEHKLQCAVQVTSAGVLTLHDPWVIPGNARYPEQGDWFPTPVWEGCTALYNEEPEYYQDPLQYFLNCIEQLLAKGFKFYTWHDLLDDEIDLSKPGILLQFDLDGGPGSFLRIAGGLDEIGVVASGMLHCEAKHWYEYDLEDVGIEQLKRLEAKGWAFGYHHNALTNVSGLLAEDSPSETLINQASLKITEDISRLRQALNIRTLTHHGGNVLNYQVPVPTTANVVCVDRSFSADLWRPIKRSFSDSGFTSRPCSMKSFVKNSVASDGLLFFRCHPFKYGNYPDGQDLAPLTELKTDLPSVDVLTQKCADAVALTRIEKQAAWLQSRKRTRDGEHLGYATFAKPLSARFVDSQHIDANIERLRKQRRPGFLRQYPWAEGDPRVIWWRLLSSFCGPGEVLNVGAMPPDQKEETRVFLDPESALLEVDIDPEREPDILADFCDPEFSLERNFDHVLLNGLPYFSNPLGAVTNAAKHLAPGGSLLIGAAAASHPERGGLFLPRERPVWRLGLEEHQGESLSLSTMLWSFDDQSIDDLMSEWSGSWSAEFIFHYWFIVAKG